jgi:PHD/YefM family antitoxin component YafN of YafNO toxin-antitoxin module
MTAVVTATEFHRNFATIQRQVQREPIEVRSHEKVTGYFISAETYQRIEKLLIASRRAYDTSELPEHLMAAVKDSRMAPEHDRLNALLDE